ncbi:MAG: RNA 2',3'-cyclic phosphodiesterase [Candidatus Woesearchaeota archaeon]
MRYFLAVPLPEDVKRELHKINSALSKFKGLRFVNPDNMHLTLLFLGENGASKKIGDLKKIKFESFLLKTSKITFFPNSGKVKLVWVELAESDELLKLQKKLSKLFGITKPYLPHITLARVKNLSSDEKAEFFDVISNLKPLKLSIPVKNFKLYSSELTVLGPVHRVIEYFESEPSLKLKK